MEGLGFQRLTPSLTRVPDGLCDLSLVRIVSKGKDPARPFLTPGERRLRARDRLRACPPGRKRLLSAVNFKVTGARG